MIRNCSISLIFSLAISTITLAQILQPSPPFRTAENAIARGDLTVDSGLTPVVKRFAPGWVSSLDKRGHETVWTAANSKDFAYIGMPIGGIGAGELYLGGDGKLWDWDIFNTRIGDGFSVEGGEAYRYPHVAGNAADPDQTMLENGFALRVAGDGKTQTRRLDKSGFSDIRFRGQYPIGYVDYAEPGFPMRVSLEAFSPFVPGDVDASSYPATVLNYTIANTGKHVMQCTLAGWLENAVHIQSRKGLHVPLRNQVQHGSGFTLINYSSVPVARGTIRAPQIFEDFETGTYANWTAEGTAFGNQPARLGEFQHATPIISTNGKYFVDTYRDNSDVATGMLRSKKFILQRSFITFLIGGGNHPNQECINLLIDGKVVRTATGDNSESLRLSDWNVSDLRGKEAQIQIVDSFAGAWGHILIDDIAFTDMPWNLEEQPDTGNMALAIIGGSGATTAIADVPNWKSIFNQGENDHSTGEAPLIGALRRTVVLKPGERQTITFVVAWYFPRPLNFALRTPTQRQYAVRFKSATDVVEHLAQRLQPLTTATRLWHDTFYDSTLPWYLLERTLGNASILATGTCYLLADGRFYAYEGRYSCPGTCTHVWGYQQTLGYLFPELERRLRKQVDFKPGIGQNADGSVAMRGEYDATPPVDGDAGVILRTYLASRMSADDAFLRGVYPSVKRLTEYFFTAYDPHHEGILQGAQHNTLDSAWYGKVSWLSLHYQAALRAAAAMADETGDHAYAAILRQTADNGRRFLESHLFNGEYFYQEADPAHRDSPGSYDGCEIDQLMGQSWAYQVGLGDIIDVAKMRTALDSLWKYNYTTDAGIYRDAFPKGRWYAGKGDSGILMATFPHGLRKDSIDKGFGFYFNECWTGSEYLLASLYMWQGMTDRALAEVRSIADRYDASKRNPWNELECGSHYSRSMSSYGVFTAACGFSYDGPKGEIGFAPRLSPENFRAVFTAAQGFGRFSQKYDANSFVAKIEMQYGKLRLTALGIDPPPGNWQVATVELDGKSVAVTRSTENSAQVIRFQPAILVHQGQSITLSLGAK